MSMILLESNSQSTLSIEKHKNFANTMYTIKEAARLMDISEHTLRYWAKSEFFPFITRDENNNRQFSKNDLEWILIVKCLRAVGTDHRSIKRYIDLCIIGDSTIPERHNIIRDVRKKAQRRMQEMRQQLHLLDQKEAFYRNIVDTNASDPYNPMNTRTAIKSPSQHHDES